MSTDRPDPSVSTEPTHRRLQEAHDKYFQDVAATSNSIMQRFQTLQIEFERALEHAWQTQDPNGLQTAQADYQNGYQAAYMDAGATDQYAQSYRAYKLAIQKALANANVDDLNFTDMAHISQSLNMVSQMAMTLSCGGFAGRNVASTVPK